MKSILKEINILELENALAIGDENKANQILDLLANQTVVDEIKYNDSSSISFEECKTEKEEKVGSSSLLTHTDLTHNNIQHLLEEAFNNGDAKMVDYCMFLLGEGV